MATRAETTGDVASSILIALLARGMRQRIEEAVSPLGIRPRHLLALNHLRDEGASAQRTLLDVVGIDPSNKGERTLAAVDRALAAVDDETLAALDAAEREQLHALLTRAAAGNAARCTAADESC